MRKFFPVVACLALLATVWGGDYVIPVLAPVSVMAQSADEVCVASTPSGRVRGLLRGDVCVYLGIPYATPPVGNLRWKPPQPMAPWAPAALNAIAARTCSQITAPSVPAGTLSGVEDCLLINIWVPAQPRRARMPVLVWLHTGAFQAANAAQPATDGARFASEENVIIVAPNYRLGPFGFLAHSALTLQDPAHRSSGNYGLLDQRAALVWVRDHIAAFGGDPRNVTIDGTSAGSHSVSLQVVSRGSAGLFHRAIMQSGSASFRWRDAAEAEAQGEQFARALGCTNVATTPACLRSKTRDEVLRALPIDQQKFVEPEAVQWGPIVDGVVVPDQPRELYRRGEFNRVPLIIGVNKDEGWIYADRSFPEGLSASDYAAVVTHEFGFDALAILDRYPAAQYPTPKDALARLTGDAEYVCEARRVARFVRQAGVAVYFYSFEYKVEDVAPGRVIHGLESNLLFGNSFGAPSNHVLTAADLALFSSMSGYWRRFAETGSPSARGDTGRWPVFTLPAKFSISDRYLVLDSTVSEANHLRDLPCNFWERYFFRSLVGTVPASRP